MIVNFINKFGELKKFSYIESKKREKKVKLKKESYVRFKPRQFFDNE